jgi:hypothetical protein
MKTTPPLTGGPHARGSVLHGFREAVVDLWGEEGLRRFAELLPADARVATLDSIVLPFEWVPIAHVVAWHEALWNGLARGDERELTKLVARAIDVGLGRFKSAFFAGITPERLVERAPELWRWQHTHGELSVQVQGASGVVTLRGHPYVDHPACRRVTAESYRHIVGMVWGAGAQNTASGPGPGPRATNVAVSWSASAPTKDTLVVRLSWRP